MNKIGRYLKWLDLQKMRLSLDSASIKVLSGLFTNLAAGWFGVVDGKIMTTGFWTINANILIVTALFLIVFLLTFMASKK